MGVFLAKNPHLLGDPNVNYPNTVKPIKSGFGFILRVS